ncbi:MAG TPA: hypothetical protein VL754_19430 [Verrucomicrobiae bacterium]|nr:hypothetical protein [Verrucomicrobiae bacterium]
MRTRLGNVIDGAVGLYQLGVFLPGYFRKTLTVADAKSEIQSHLARRSESFLELALRRIYGAPGSPYLRLLKRAGCEFADLRSHVLGHGLEPTLERLAREGVYLTSEEFKGKREVVRGTESFRVTPADFSRPERMAGFFTQSSGSRGAPRRTRICFDWHLFRAAPIGLFLHAHDLYSSAYAYYDSMLSWSGGVQTMLACHHAGMRVERWFAREVPLRGALPRFHHRLNNYVIITAARWFGRGLPRPEPIDPADLNPVLRWALEQRKRGRIACIDTVANNAVRIAAAASAAGESLAGVKFIVHGEPMTGAKRDIIERSGAGYAVRYSSEPSLQLAVGCARPVYTDEVHVNQHLYAVTRQGFPLADPYAPSDALLFTTLHPLAPIFLLNAQNGDYGTLERRNCGCALEEAGLGLHLHGIRSFEKFTGEGLNYYFGDLLELIEKKLPAEFGGGPGDYQLAEEEEAGRTCLTLRVDPSIASLDEEKILARLRAELGKGSWEKEFQARVWDDAGALKIRRVAPAANARGKILPLEVRKSGP